MRLNQHRTVALGVAGLTITALGLTAAPAEATYTGRDGMITFAADTGTGYQLYTVWPDGHGLKQITRLAGDAVNPDWSPDGRHIVFELDRPNGAGCEVEMLNPDGGHLRSLTTSATDCEAQPAFTPDGHRVVFEEYDPATNVDAIWIMDLAGGHRRQITLDTNSGVTDPNVSPDGRTITAVRYGSGDLHQALFSWSLDGSHERQLTPFGSDVAIKHDWSPDGQHLVFSDHADDTTKAVNIVTIRPDGSGWRNLTHLTDPLTHANVGSYSPDGRWIVYRFEDNGQSGLFRMRSDGTHVQTILPMSSFRPRFIDWGPR